MDSRRAGVTNSLLGSFIATMLHFLVSHGRGNMIKYMQSNNVMDLLRCIANL